MDKELIDMLSLFGDVVAIGPGEEPIACYNKLALFIDSKAFRISTRKLGLCHEWSGYITNGVDVVSSCF